MSGDDKIPEPHPLPLTRQWVEDYKRGTKSEVTAEQPRCTVPVDENGCPDLQALIERAGRRYATSIGEAYIEDPFRRMREAPHQGGYAHITPEEWAEYDRAMTDWQAARRPSR